jgi:quercetin dioxygenase-like cupin family protein
MNTLKTMCFLAAGLLAAGLLFQSNARALEPSAAIKTTTLMKTSSSWDGTPIAYPSGQAEITGLLVEIAPGGETGWHLHPVPSFGVLLEGELEVRLKDGAVRRLKPGDTLAEVVNTLHNGRNVGTTPLKLVVFYAGVVGQPLSVKETP